jgi:crotonobetainyl-CoA:carnitine CoA-transferase CaiB-like acyl-CoA transferase
MAPLSGIRVVEFSHMIFGPTCGLVLADLGADVVKVEPPGIGDRTRQLGGAGAGFFPMFNRNKRSISLDMKTERGMDLALRLIDKSDVLIENFRPGAMDKLGLGYATLAERNPRLIYCSAKGFLPGPHEHRAALDEVVQMMSGLAYMTGPPGRPLRAGASVVDIMAGAFLAIGVQAALRERDQTGKGQLVTSALYETAAFLCGQHMMQHQVTGKVPMPMPARDAAWAVYDVFDCSDEGGQVFVGVVSNTQWDAFCRDFGFEDYLDDPELATNTIRCLHRDKFMDRIRATFKTMTSSDLIARCEALGLPYAPIGRPEDLADDVHLNASGGLTPVTLLDGKTARTPTLPFTMGGSRPGPGSDLPKLGENGREVLSELGLSDAEVDALLADGILEVHERPRDA